MSINRIEISIKNKNRFGLIAFLVDRDDYLDLIEEIRGKLHLKTLPYTFNNYPFPYKEANNVTNYYQRGVCGVYDVYSCFKDICEENDIKVSDLDYKLALAYEYAQIIAEKLSRSSLYIPVILSSIMTGIVREGDFMPTNSIELSNENLQGIQSKLSEDEKIVAITINPESTWQEVKEVFEHMQMYRFKTKGKINNGLFDVYNNESWVYTLLKTRTKIKTVRDWYWKKKSMSWGDLSKSINKNKKIKIPNETIRTAVRNYAEALIK